MDMRLPFKYFIEEKYPEAIGLTKLNKSNKNITVPTKVKNFIDNKKTNNYNNINNTNQHGGNNTNMLIYISMLICIVLIILTYK